MTAMFTLVSLVKISAKGNKMAVKKLTSVYVSLQSGHEGVSGIAKGKFTVEDVASGSALVELNSDTSFTSAKAAVIAKLEEDGSTVVDATS